MLIDPGADTNHISGDFCKLAKTCTKPAPYGVQLAKKSTQNLSVTRNKVTIGIGSYSQSFRMASNPLNYDVILGNKWCAKRKAAIECEINIFKIFHHHKLNRSSTCELKLKKYR